MTLWVEIFFVSFIEDGVKYFRIKRAIGDNKHDPDIAVLKLVKSELDVTPNILKEDYLVHSTSWRYEKPEEVILTYLVIAEEIDFGSHKTVDLFCNEMKMAVSKDAKVPRPKYIDERNVISHGLANLALLMTREKKEFRKIFKQSNCQLIVRLKKEISGRI
jgi:hypothetical protein